MGAGRVAHSSANGYKHHNVATGSMSISPGCGVA